MLTILVFISVTASSATAANVPASDFEVLLRAAAERAVPSDVHVVAVTSVPKLPRSDEPLELTVVPLARRLVGRVSARVEARYGQRTIRFQVVLVLEQTYSVVRLAHLMRAGEILRPTDVVTAQERSSAPRSDALADPALAIGKRLRADAAGGVELFARDLEAVPIVQAKDMVRVTVRHGALTASAPGEAQQAGARGDTIRVVNLLSSKVILARVVDADSVEVMP